MADQKNLVVAFALSLIVLIGFQYLYIEPREAERQRLAEETAAQSEQVEPPDALQTDLAPEFSTGAVVNEAPAAEPAAPQPPARRVALETARLQGSISLRGGRIDDVVLADYFDRIGEGAENIRLFEQADSDDAYFGEFGWWARAEQGLSLPTGDTVWDAPDAALTTETPLVMTWDNGQGLAFTRTVEVDENFLFTVTDTVTNTTPGDVALGTYGRLNRNGTPDTLGFFILHEGPVGVLGETLEEVDYDDLRDVRNKDFASQGGWIGITDKYWLAALIPDQSSEINARFLYRSDGGPARYGTNYRTDREIVPAGGSYTVTHRLFAGAKEVEVIDSYEDAYNITLFHKAIDWGWFHFLTRPLFYILHFFYGIAGNFGVAILLLTVLVKLAFFPLANKQYESMSKMKALHPKMIQLRERYADDKMRQQQELMALYKKEKVNPLAGCMPILIQIPVFFALYKTLFVTIEMRHQPFFGWIKDLSAADPLTPLNLFGLIPWDPPSFIAIGIWPLIMGLTMYLQQKMNPQPADPIQAKVLMAMPIVFTFILAPFPVGLVIYWTWNNVLSIAQQWVIMRRMGVSIGDG